METRSIERICFLARTNARRPFRVFGVKQADRLFHMYVIGKTGTGKSTLLENLVRQDIQNGEGVTLVDPAGDLVEHIARQIPEHRRGDLIYFDVPDDKQPFGYNPLKRVNPKNIPLAASGMLEVFHKTWGERAWGQRMEHILRNCLLALLEQQEATLPDVLRLLRDDSFRKSVAANTANQQVRDYWLHEYPKYSYRYRADAIAPIQSKVGAFLSDPTLFRILTKPKQMLYIRKLMDEGKILLVNLAKGKLGEDSSALLGGLLVTTIGLAGFSRANIPEESRRDFYVYLDEFQNFTTESMANMLSELRKYRIAMTVAHQYLYQLDEAIRYAVLGNAGTLISFRLGPKDAAFMAREFEPKFDTIDVLNLPNHHVYLKLMIDGAPSQPFSATTLAPWQVPFRRVSGRAAA